MRVRIPLIPALVALLSCQQLVTARSHPQRPLKRILHPTTLALDIHPRRNSPSSSSSSSTNPLASRSLPPTTLTPADSFRLSIRLDGRTYHLHLSPNTDLFHPSARINYYDVSGSVARSEPLLARDWRVYEGSVVAPDRTVKRWAEDAAGGLHRRSRSAEDELGWARIVVHEHEERRRGGEVTYEGAFFIRGLGTHHVLTREHYLRTRHPEDPDPEDGEQLVVLRDADLVPTQREGGGMCAHDALDFNSRRDLNPVLEYASTLHPRGAAHLDPFDLDASLVRRQGNDISGGNVTTNFIDRIGSHEGCKATQTFIYMGVAADCTYVSQYGGTSNATSQILNDWNSVSALYKSTFNVSMGIVELAVQEPDCPTTTNASVAWNVACSDSVTLNDRLSLFSAWRGAKGGADGAGLWHLMSGCPTGTEVGVAWLGQLCNVQASGQTGEVVSGTGVSTATRTEWQVIAHEIGHNFGAIHDCADGCTLTSSCCPATTTQCSSASVYIMDAVSNVGENTFSPCSVGNICASMDTMNTTCLIPAESATQVISLQMCGNGIVETGEDCDPGKGNTSPCCDSSTCKFTNNAVCDPLSSDCCTSSCTFAPSTKVCRPAVDASCDIAESCTGSSADCPEDKTVSDGTSCSNSNGTKGLACASGKCTSPDLQCQTVGASLNLTKACPSSNDKSCQVSCQDPSNSQQCIVLQSSLIDGSPCGYGGKCQGNVCKAGSIGDTIKSWYMKNLQISIPVTVVAGVLVLLILWRIFTACLGCCRRRNNGGGKVKPTLGRQRLASASFNNNGPGVYQMREPPAGQTPRGYVSPGMSYPPSYADDHPDHQHPQQAGNPNYGNPAAQNQNPFEQQQYQRGWVDPREYNGAGYVEPR